MVAQLVHPPSPLPSPSSVPSPSPFAAAETPAPSASSSSSPTVLTSRQKSCDACVLGKRRCDRRAPICSRCAARSVSCVYRRRSKAKTPVPPRTPIVIPPEPDTAPSSADPGPPSPTSPLPPSRPGCLDDDNNQYDAFMTDPDTDAALATALGLADGATRAQTAAAAAAVAASVDPFRTSSLPSLPPVSALRLASLAPRPPSPHVDSSVLNFLPSLADSPPARTTPSVSSTATSTSWLYSRFEFPMPLVPIFTDNTEKLSVAKRKQHDCPSDFFTPWEASDPRTKTGFLVQTVKSFPTIFAHERGTSFLHWQLFSVAAPRSVVHAWTSCVVYAARTPATTVWANRIISEGVAGLLRSQGADDTDPGSGSTPSTMLPLQRLARVFSLLMYQIVRVFDGDIALSARAARDMPILRDWTDDLARLSHSLSSLRHLDMEALRSKPPSSWELWVFNESVRRVVLVSVAFICMYNILQDRPVPSEYMEAPHTYTASSHLWEAGSSVDFYRAWWEKSFWLVDSFTVEPLLAVAQPNDLDELTRLFIVLKAGIDKTEHFLSGVPEG